MDINQWLAYDEQIVKSVSTFFKFLQRFNPLKSITHGEFRYIFGVYVL